MFKIDELVKKLQKAKEELEKARPKMSDEYDPNEDPYEGEPEDTGVDREFNPDEEESGADDWLKENDPKYGKGDEYEEYGDGEDEDAHQQAIDEDLGEEKSPEAEQRNPPPRASIKADDSSEEVAGKKGRFEQPSREDLTTMRNYTRPWEQRAREAQALKADPSKNPELARHGNIVEARNQSHADRNTAYRQLTSSNEYKNADPITQMEMDDKFENDWKFKNPEHLSNAMNAHQQAHEKGKGAKDIHAAAKDAQIRNIIAGGGHSGDGFSLEEGMQHVGGTKGEEGTQATIKQDPASSFAMGNQDFINQYSKDYANKAKKVGNIDDMMNYDEGSKRDINRILGSGPQKDPKFEKFFAHYHPLIGMSAHKTLQRLGLDPKHPDIDMSMLHEAGMHGLIQAMNDYDHENPAKASFSTHAGNKIRGLQMTAMKNQDAIPTEVRQAQKKFAAGPQAPKVSAHSMITQSKHPTSPDRADRLKRISAARTIRKPAGSAIPSSKPTPTIQTEGDEE
jgi:hypothetical protein